MIMAWGRVGRLVDRLTFRPLMAWGTRWSFDRLRLWCERDITPERSLRNGLAEAAARVAAIAVAGQAHPLLAVAAAAAAVTLPTLPTTPSSRRCLRRPPDRVERRVDLRVPELIAGDAVVRESYDDTAGCFRIQVSVANRRLGPLFGYEGSFSAEFHGATDLGIRAGLRPLREEARG
ncbi:hypothetical protein BJF90_16045 [Pseudonocardia sp. CNS-004]|nr:hypothetical protein BJF90_16045 [Pseudonocardia sp. CNS-004]